MEMRQSIDKISPRAGCCDGAPVTPPLSDDDAERAAHRLRALADPTRLRMLSLLARHSGHVCVCEVVSAFALEQPTISYHLKVLREAGLVSAERRGPWAYYRVEPDGLRAMQEIVALARG